MQAIQWERTPTAFPVMVEPLQRVPHVHRRHPTEAIPNGLCRLVCMVELSRTTHRSSSLARAAFVDQDASSDHLLEPIEHEGFCLVRRFRVLLLLLWFRRLRQIGNGREQLGIERLQIQLLCKERNAVAPCLSIQRVRRVIFFEAFGFAH